MCTWDRTANSKYRITHSCELFWFAFRNVFFVLQLLLIWSFVTSVSIWLKRSEYILGLYSLRRKWILCCFINTSFKIFLGSPTVWTVFCFNSYISYIFVLIVYIHIYHIYMRVSSSFFLLPFFSLTPPPCVFQFGQYQNECLICYSVLFFFGWI